jgi:hypothetical protein
MEAVNRINEYFSMDEELFGIVIYEAVVKTGIKLKSICIRK